MNFIPNTSAYHSYDMPKWKVRIRANGESKKTKAERIEHKMKTHCGKTLSVPFR